MRENLEHPKVPNKTQGLFDFKFGCPVIELVIENVKFEVLLDTGFNGYLMLSQKMIDKIGLEEMGLTDYSTASGEEKKTKVYKCTLEFLGEEIDVPILSTDAGISLAGMDLFQDCRIVIEKSKGIVEIIKTNNQ